MTSLQEYQERIAELARSKGWSDDIHWLELGIFKETGELVQAIEKFEDGNGESILDVQKEFGDVIFFLFQTMYHFNINLDEALDMVITDNTKKKKKTIDSSGKMVRK